MASERDVGARPQEPKPSPSPSRKAARTSRRASNLLNVGREPIRSVIVTDTIPSVNVDASPELGRLADEVRRTGLPCVLRRGSDWLRRRSEAVPLLNHLSGGYAIVNITTDADVYDGSDYRCDPRLAAAIVRPCSPGGRTAAGPRETVERYIFTE